MLSGSPFVSFSNVSAIVANENDIRHASFVESNFAARRHATGGCHQSSLLDHTNRFCGNRTQRWKFTLVATGNGAGPIHWRRLIDNLPPAHSFPKTSGGRKVRRVGN